MIASEDNTFSGTIVVMGDDQRHYYRCNYTVACVENYSYVEDPPHKYMSGLYKWMGLIARAVFGWCFDRFDGFSCNLLYYQTLTAEIINLGTRCRKPAGFWSGFV